MSDIPEQESTSDNPLEDLHEELHTISHSESTPASIRTAAAALDVALMAHPPDELVSLHVGFMIQDLIRLCNKAGS